MAQIIQFPPPKDTLVDDGDVIIQAFRRLDYKPQQSEILKAAVVLSRCKDKNPDYRSAWLADRLREVMYP